MRLDLTDEQRLLLTTTRRFLEREAPLAAVRALADAGTGFDQAVWARAAALGWTSLLVPEELGGGSTAATGLHDLAIVAEELGRWVHPGPLIPVNVVAAVLGREQGSLLDALLCGTTVATWAVAEPRTGWDLDAIETTARRDGGSYLVTGRKAHVEEVSTATVALVTARLGRTLCQVLIPLDAEGVRVTHQGGIDLVRRMGEVSLTEVRVPADALVVTEPEHLLHRALVLQCAETMGIVDHVLGLTIAYALDRTAFGRPIGSYQALKHRLADAKAWLEAGHGITQAAIDAVVTGARDAGEVVSAMKVHVGDRSMDILQDCVQIHGGIGVTWEHDLHLFLRRATVNRAMYGDPAYHRERLCRLAGV